MIRHETYSFDQCKVTFNIQPFWNEEKEKKNNIQQFYWIIDR